jgi:cold shock protein
MLAGTVKWFDTRKGYGFIVAADGQDVMAHFSAIEGDGYRSLHVGERVDYEARRTTRGWQATRIRRRQVDGHPRTPPRDSLAPEGGSV